MVAEARRLRDGGREQEALHILEQRARAAPASSFIFRALGDVLAFCGRREAAQAAFARAAGLDEHRAAMGSAIAKMRAGRVEQARLELEAIQARDPSHVYSLLALANLELQAGDAGAARVTLERATDQYPNFDPAQRMLARACFEAGDYAAASAAAAVVARLSPERPEAWFGLADAHMAALQPEAAREAFQTGLKIAPSHARGHMGLGHALKALGQAHQAAASYRRAVELDASLGEAWWSLADLKTYRFTEDEHSAMQARLEHGRLDPYDAASINYALGKAQDDAGRIDEAFEFYQRGARIRAQLEPFDADRFIRICKQIQDAAPVLPDRHDPPRDRPTPIFIVGLPRSGSTLVEQILASHSQITASGELPHWPVYAQALAADGDYAATLARLTQDQLTALGERYFTETKPYQGQGAFFVDKTPNNFLHLALIGRAIPHAIFIDVRRDPRDWGWSAFRQNFGRGQAYTYDLLSLAMYNLGYQRLMDHWIGTSPGRISLVRYEDLVEDPQSQISALLAACGLCVEPACFKFHETRRAVNTPSAEQVRQPIFRSGIGQWRRAARHLQPYLALIDKGL